MVVPKHIFSLIGPPGSGKGYYGRYLASAFDLSLVGMSSVLRQMRPELDLASGHLIDDTLVTDTLFEYLKSQTTSSGFMLDGFPRTPQQIELVSQRWSEEFQIQAAIKLDVPDYVCETNMLGRRHCEKCDVNFNVNGVVGNGWVLPPLLPPAHGKKSNASCTEEKCSSHWITRSDDVAEVVGSRLKTYHSHMDCILEHFERKGRLLKLTPYRGVEDVENLVSAVEEWVATH